MSPPRAGVIVRYRDEYLCVFQNASKLWGFPKGSLKDNETFKECACRELEEETGIQISPSSLSYKNSIYVKKREYYHHYFFYNPRVKPRIMIDNNEIIDYKWMTLIQLYSYNISYFTDQVVRIIFNSNEKRKNKDNEIEMNTYRKR